MPSYIYLTQSVARTQLDCPWRAGGSWGDHSRGGSDWLDMLGGGPVRADSPQQLNHVDCELDWSGTPSREWPLQSTCLSSESLIEWDGHSVNICVYGRNHNNIPYYLNFPVLLVSHQPLGLFLESYSKTSSFKSINNQIHQNTNSIYSWGWCWYDGFLSNNMKQWTHINYPHI